jgi:hypothetical protein
LYRERAVPRVLKFAVHLLKVLEMMSMSHYTGLNPFNLSKDGAQIALFKGPVRTAL